MAIGSRLVRYHLTFTGTGPKGEQMEVKWGNIPERPTDDDRERAEHAAITSFEAIFGVMSVKCHASVGIDYDIGKSDTVYLERINDRVKIVGLESRRHVETRLVPQGLVAIMQGRFTLTDLGEEALAEIRRTGFGAEVRAVLP